MFGQQGNIVPGYLGSTLYEIAVSTAVLEDPTDSGISHKISQRICKDLYNTIVTLPAYLRPEPELLCERETLDDNIKMGFVTV